MAYDIRTKAAAMADLLLGSMPREVATANRVPERTVRRWRTEAWAMVRTSLSIDARAQLAELQAIWPNLLQNGHGAWGALHCNAKTRSGDPCLNAPVRGKRRCRMHGGRVK
jgi:hypothetical protein